MQVVAIIVGVIIAIVAISYVDEQSSQVETEPTNTEKLAVVSSFYPIHEFVLNVGGDKIDATLLMPPGVEPHDWDPSIRDIQQLKEADVVVINGMGFEAWIDDLDDIGFEGVVVDTSTKLVESGVGKGGEDDGERHEGEGKWDTGDGIGAWTGTAEGMEQQAISIIDAAMSIAYAFVVTIDILKIMDAVWPGEGEMHEGEGEMHEGEGEMHEGEGEMHEGDGEMHEGEMHEGDGEMHEGEMHEGDGEMHEGDGEMHEGDGEMHEGDGEMHGHKEKGDPHIWLNPVYAKVQVQSIADAFALQDPVNAAHYQARATTYTKELDTIDSEIRTQLESCKRDFIAFHMAFSYFAKEYGLTQHTILKSGSPHGEVTAKTLENVIDTARDLGITTIFNEEAVDPKTAKVLADSLGGEVLILSPLEVAVPDTKQGEKQTYISRMTQNLENLKKVLC